MTKKVQLWQNGLMMGAIPQTEATELLNAGTYRAMQYNNRAILGMIARALNPMNPEGTQHGERTVSHTVLAELETTPNRYGLTICMTDGRQFQIIVEEVL